ncbi:VOC family protein [Methylocella sp.]|uniref:VOC family protein n=1 Tax=Methylocella sp. TaxID=1978226 RepID=UPI0037835C97
MTKAIHMMVRVADERRSVEFYENAFGFRIADRLGFDDFTLVYLRSPDADFEIELTVNHDRKEPYVLGDGYGHLAFVVDDLERKRDELETLGLNPNPVKEMFHDGAPLARFFFVTDPDGYKIEVLQRRGRYR